MGLCIKLVSNRLKRNRSFSIVVLNGKRSVRGRPLDKIGYLIGTVQAKNVLVISKKKYQLWLMRGAKPSKALKRFLKYV